MKEIEKQAQNVALPLEHFTRTLGNGVAACLFMRRDCGHDCM